MSFSPAEAAHRRAEDIYVARGERTLGPYTPAEAAARVARGDLLAEDHAARDGDATWVPLSQFLTALPAVADREPEPESPPAVAPAPGLATVSPGRTHRGWQFAVLAALLGGYCLGAGPRWLERWANSRPAPPVTARNTPAASPTPPAVVTSTPAPVQTPAPSVVATGMPVAVQTPAGTPLLVSNSRPLPAVNSHLHGLFVLTAPAGEEIDPAGVRVAAYPLSVLELYLAQRQVQAQAEINRIETQIQAAEADLTARRADEQAALRAWQDCAPTDPLRSSLRFAYEAARAAVKTSEEDHQYLLDLRRMTAGGAFYFQDLPEPTVQTQTNAQGRFVLDLPPEGYPYALAASVQQSNARGGLRAYYWLVKVGSPQGAEPGTLLLDRSNLASANAPESLIHLTE